MYHIDVRYQYNAFYSYFYKEIKETKKEIKET